MRYIEALELDMENLEQELSELRDRLAKTEEENTVLRGYAVDVTITAALLLVAAAFFLFKWQQGWI